MIITTHVLHREDVQQKLRLEWSVQLSRRAKPACCDRYVVLGCLTFDTDQTAVHTVSHVGDTMLLTT